MPADFVWWIGAVHIALYAALCTTGAIWFTLERVLKWTKSTGVVIVWYANRIRARKKLPPLTEPTDHGR